MCSSSILEFVKYWKTADREIIFLESERRPGVPLEQCLYATMWLGRQSLPQQPSSGDDNSSGANTSSLNMPICTAMESECRTAVILTLSEDQHKLNTD